MSQEVSKWLVNASNWVSNLLINGIDKGYNPFTNHVQISWDIQVQFVCFGLFLYQRRHQNVRFQTSSHLGFEVAAIILQDGEIHLKVAKSTEVIWLETSMESTSGWLTGWWFQPIWKILVKMGISPK